MVKGKLFKVRYQSLAHTWAPLLGSEQLAHTSFPVGSQGEPASFRDDHCREPAALAVHPSVPSEHSWPRLVPCWVPPSRVSRNVLQHWSCWLHQWLHQRPCEHSQTRSWDTGSKQQNEDFHNTTPHHKSPHHIASHRIASHRIASHHITSHHITAHHITSHHITSLHITAHRANITSTSNHIGNETETKSQTPCQAFYCINIIAFISAHTT